MNHNLTLGKKSNTEKRITYIVCWIICVTVALMSITPLFWGIGNSLKTASEFFESSFALPKKWVFFNYIKVFTDFKYRNFTYLDMLFNSMWLMTAQIIPSTLSSALLAYAVARYRFPGRNLIYAAVIFVQVVPIIGSGAAGFKLSMALGMINNPFVIWIRWLSGFDFQFIIFYGYFKSISQTYSEAAKIDGAGNIRILMSIVFPQAFPAIMALVITAAPGAWNDYGTVMIYLNNFPNLAYGLFLFNTGSNYIENSRAIYFAALIISSIPVILLYAANQKLILANVTAGGLKG